MGKKHRGKVVKVEPRRNERRKVVGKAFAPVVVVIHLIGAAFHSGLIHHIADLTVSIVSSVEIGHRIVR